MDLQMKGDVVLVTGSSSGIGRATAIACGAEGARVVVTYYRNRAGAEDTARGCARRAARRSSLTTTWDPRGHTGLSRAGGAGVGRAAPAGQQRGPDGYGP